MQNQKLVKTKNQNLFVLFSRIKFKVQITNFLRFAKRRHKGRSLTRVISMTSPTPKRTEQNQGDPKFDNL